MGKARRLMPPRAPSRLIRAVYKLLGWGPSLGQARQYARWYAEKYGKVGG
jgi:hypothetical protein